MRAPQWLSDGRLGNTGARKVTPLRDGQTMTLTLIPSHTCNSPTPQLYSHQRRFLFLSFLLSYLFLLASSRSIHKRSTLKLIPPLTLTPTQTQYSEILGKPECRNARNINNIGNVRNAGMLPHIPHNLSRLPYTKSPSSQKKDWTCYTSSNLHSTEAMSQLTFLKVSLPSGYNS